jgi:pimeloyl-ACP methyl ester carboxylesterase
MKQGGDNPDGPLDDATAEQFESGLKDDRDGFFDQFTTQFFSANGELKVSEQQRQDAVTLCRQSDQTAVLGCMEAFATTDFGEDLGKVTVPALVIHGDADAIVPYEGSGKRTHEAIAGSELVVIEGAPHGLNVSHADRLNAALIEFLAT